MSNLDLNKLEEKLDNGLSNETSESLNEWLKEKRMSNDKQSSIEWYDNEIGKLFNQFTVDKITIYEFRTEQLKLKQQAKEKYEHEMCVFADEYASYILDQSKLGIKGAMVSMCAWTFFKNRRK
jgi:hypothetical protein